MASNYPGSLDSFDTIASDKKTSDSVGGRTHRQMHNDLGDAIEAVQTELGTTPSGSYATVKARFEAIEGSTLPQVDAKGDLIVGTADNTYDNLGVGTNDTVLLAASGETKGVKWAQVPTAAIQDGAVTPAKMATTGRFTFPTGAANGYGFTSGASHLSGTGTPEGVVTAAPGSTWLQTDSTTDVKGWIRWIKASGTGNTGWVAGPEADTGWRKIVSWTSGVQDGSGQIGTVNTSQYTLSGTGYIAIRRIGAYVEWWIRGGITKPNAGPHKLFTVDNRVQAGFRADGGSTYGVSAPFHRDCDFLGTNGIGDTPAFASSTASVDMSWQTCRHYTADAWPTSLPGSAA